jgi:polyisoprenoid-binding protein YceI
MFVGPDPTSVAAVRTGCERIARKLSRHGVLVCALVASSTSLAAEFALDASHTIVYFAASHHDIALVRGRFAKLRGSVQYDADAKTGAMLVSVQTGSIDTGNSAMDNVLRSDQFLDAERYPEAHFTSERFVFDYGKLVAIEGKLSLHGVERPLRLTVQRFVCREVALGIVRHYVCGGDFHAVLKRSDFGMTRFLPEVGDEVDLAVSGEAIRQ